MKTHEIIGISIEAYEDKVFKHWFKYCELHSVNTEEFQSLLANTALNKWWLQNLEMLENEFKAEAQPYINDASLREYLSELWFKNIIKLMPYYSPPLFKNKLQTIHGH